MLSCSNGDITIKFHYKRKDDYKNWSFYIWERDIYGRDINPREVSIDRRGIIEEDGSRAVTVFLNRKKLVNKLGFLVKRGRENEWLEKDIDLDRYIPLKKKLDVYVLEGEREIFFSKQEVDSYLESIKKVQPVIKEKRKVKVRIHYKRYDKDYDGWSIWLWKRYLLDSEKEGSSYCFNGEDDFGKFAEFYIEVDDDLVDLGIKIKRFDWQEKDVDMNRYISINRINDKSELEVYLLQYEEEIFYNGEDVKDSPKILKARIEGPNRICAYLNYPIMDGNINDFKVMVKGKSLDIKYVNRIQNAKNYEIITKDELVIDEKYTLSKNGYGKIQVSIENRYDSEEFKEKYVYNGNDLGVTYTKEFSKFKTYSPVANSVKVCLYDSGVEGNLLKEVDMIPGESGTWEAKIDGDLDGLFYIFKPNNYGKEREAVDICKGCWGEWKKRSYSKFRGY